MFLNDSTLKINFESQITFCILLFHFLRFIATEKGKKRGHGAYSVPAIMILKLKLVISPALDDADKVNVAPID